MTKVVCDLCGGTGMVKATVNDYPGNPEKPTTVLCPKCGGHGFKEV